MAQELLVDRRIYGRKRANDEIVPNTGHFLILELGDYDYRGITANSLPWSRGNIAVVNSIPAVYYRPLCPHYRGITADTAVFPSSPLPCSSLIHRLHNFFCRLVDWWTTVLICPIHYSLLSVDIWPTDVIVTIARHYIELLLSSIYDVLCVYVVCLVFCRSESSATSAITTYVICYTSLLQRPIYTSIILPRFFINLFVCTHFMDYLH